MLDKSNNAQQLPVPDLKAIFDAIILWDHPVNIKAHLRELMDHYLLYSTTTLDHKKNVYSSFAILKEALNGIEQACPEV